MCVLAHYLENAGIATVVISLVRLHSEKTHPPRALFVPFELGRPLGNPGDNVGQTNVLKTALSMVEHCGPQPMLADFPDPTPDTAGEWKPLFDLPEHTELSAKSMQAEGAAILTPYASQLHRTKRTTFGNSGLSPDEVIGLVAGLFNNGADQKTRISSKLIRFAIDDLKSLYLEAACLNQHPLSSAQLYGWFWRRTVAGQAIARLRADFATGNDKGRQMIANFMVPGEWVDKLGL